MSRDSAQIEQQYERELAKNGVLMTLPVGKSMWPLLRSRRDQIVIERLDGDPCKNDVILYRRGDRYILHRLIGKKDGVWLIRGDNCLKAERDITRADMLGVLTGIYRGERYIDCRASRRYRAYVAVWRALYPIRAAIMVTGINLKRIARGLKAAVKGKKNANLKAR